MVAQICLWGLTEADLAKPRTKPAKPKKPQKPPRERKSLRRLDNKSSGIVERRLERWLEGVEMPPGKELPRLDTSTLLSLCQAVCPERWGEPPVSRIAPTAALPGTRDKQAVLAERAASPGGKLRIRGPLFHPDDPSEPPDGKAILAAFSRDEKGEITSSTAKNGRRRPAFCDTEIVDEREFRDSHESGYKAANARVGDTAGDVAEAELPRRALVG